MSSSSLSRRRVPRGLFLLLLVMLFVILLDVVHGQSKAHRRRLYIKRYLNPEDGASVAPQATSYRDAREEGPEDEGDLSQCELDRTLVEGCIGQHPGDTKTAYQCYSSATSTANPGKYGPHNPDPCYNKKVTEVADQCHKVSESDSAAAFQCMFQAMGLEPIR